MLRGLSWLTGSFNQSRNGSVQFPDDSTLQRTNQSSFMEMAARGMSWIGINPFLLPSSSGEGPVRNLRFFSIGGADERENIAADEIGENQTKYSSREHHKFVAIPSFVGHESDAIEPQEDEAQSDTSFHDNKEGIARVPMTIEPSTSTAESEHNILDRAVKEESVQSESNALSESSIHQQQSTSSVLLVTMEASSVLSTTIGQNDSEFRFSHLGDADGTLFPNMEDTDTTHLNQKKTVLFMSPLRVEQRIMDEYPSPYNSPVHRSEAYTAMSPPHQLFTAPRRSAIKQKEYLIPVNRDELLDYDNISDRESCASESFTVYEDDLQESIDAPPKPEDSFYTSSSSIMDGNAMASASENEYQSEDEIDVDDIDFSALQPEDNTLNDTAETVVNNTTAVEISQESLSVDVPTSVPPSGNNESTLMDTQTFSTPNQSFLQNHVSPSNEGACHKIHLDDENLEESSQDDTTIHHPSTSLRALRETNTQDCGEIDEMDIPNDTSSTPTVESPELNRTSLSRVNTAINDSLSESPSAMRRSGRIRKPVTRSVYPVFPTRRSLPTTVPLLVYSTTKEQTLKVDETEMSPVSAKQDKQPKTVVSTLDSQNVTLIKKSPLTKKVVQKHTDASLDSDLSTPISIPVKKKSEFKSCKKCRAKISMGPGSNTVKLIVHAASHCNVKMYSCSDCGFSANSNLKRHIDEQCSGAVSKSNSTLANRNKWTAIAFKCFPESKERINDWNKNTKKASIYEASARAISPSGVVHCGDRSEKEDSPNKKVSCRICHVAIRASSNSRYNLLHHAKIHVFTKQFQCSHCPYSNASRKHVVSHLEKCSNGAELRDEYSVKMKEEWRKMLIRCFPFMKEWIQNCGSISGKRENRRKIVLDDDESD